MIHLDFPSVGFIWRNYQTTFITDTSKYIAVLKSRQIGFSEAIAFIPTYQAIINPTNIYFVSTNQDQSKDLVKKAKKWIEATSLLSPMLAPMLAIRSATVTKIELSNGTVIQALPCRAASVRGKTGIIILDEVDHIHDIWELWQAIAPAISTNPHLRLITCSTPYGDKNFLYRVFNDPTFGTLFSKHQVDVHQAISQGHPKEVLELRSTYSDDSWNQEFMCSFLGDDDRYFDNDLLSLCSSLDPIPSNRTAFGIDIGRTRDRSCYAIVSGENGRYQLQNFKQLRQNMPHPEQLEEFISAISDLKPKAIIIDGIGEGSSTADSLKNQFHNVTKHHSTAKYYDQFIPALKAEMQSGNVYIPNDPLILQAFSKIKKQMTTNGPKFIATRDGEGHADLFYALLFAFSQVYVKPNQKSSKGSVHSAQFDRSVKW